MMRRRSGVALREGAGRTREGCFHYARGGIKMFRYLFCAAAFVAAVPTSSTGNEIDGFRLGMTREQVMKLAAERGYTFGNAVQSGSNWVSYVLFKDGPSISFCGNVLSAVTKTDKSNLHGFVHLADQWRKAFGAPDETLVSQMYSQGAPISRLEHRWVRQANVRQDLSFSQFGTGDLQVSFSYIYISHPCSPSNR